MSSPLSANMESILDRFDDAWNGPTPPSIEDYLALCPPEQRLALLVELVRIDLERRLKRGERVRLEETYLSRFPELNKDRASVVALIVQEFELRRRREPNLSPAEYFERWPEYREELTPLLSSHPTLSITEGETNEKKAPTQGGQATEETRDVFVFLAPPQAADEIGRLGSYRILKVLGSGGMGVVFLAEDAQLKRSVALKVMRPGLAANDAARQRFLREARAMAAFKHDHIVTIHQVAEDRGVPFLAMEYLEGETLHERLKRETVLPLAEAVRIGLEIADGLAAAHARGLVHRDIKPANIWLEFRRDPQGSANALAYGSRRNETGRVKILDFGLARSVWSKDAHLTQTGAIMGTPAFMSPEQARGEEADPRSDLFSLGCVLYHMVTGRPPFQGRDVVSTLFALANDHPPPPRQLNPQIPAALNHLIQRLLAKNVADRPASAASVVEALQALASEGEPAPSPRRRRLVPATLAALLLISVAVLMAGIVIRIRSKDGRETTIEVPEGSKVTIEQEAKVVVVPADAPHPGRDRERAVAPRPLLPDARGSVVPPLAEGTEPLSRWALVQRPARLKGVRSWTIETHSLRAGAISCAMRPDGKQLAVSSFDGVIRLYDPSTGRLEQALFGQHKTLDRYGRFSLTWSPDGKRLASGCKDGTLHIWNMATGQILHTIPPPSHDGRSVAWSPDGKWLAFALNRGVMLWNTESWKQLSFPAETRNPWTLRNPYTLAWSPDSKMLAAGGEEPRVVWLWEVPSGKLLHIFEGFNQEVRGLAWSPDGKTLAAAAFEDKLCRLWDVHSGKLLRTLELQGEEGIRTVAYSPDGKSLAVGGFPWGFILFDTQTWKEFRGFGPGSNWAVASWSPDGATLAAASYEGCVSIYNIHAGKEVRRIETHPHIGYFFAWSPDGNKMATSDTDTQNGFHIWDRDTGVPLHRIENVGRWPAWSPSGSSLAVLDNYNNRVQILDGESGQRLRSWNTPVIPHLSPYLSPVWSPDGKLIATAASDNTVQVWSAVSGRLIHTLQGHTARIDRIAWSPDGKWIASGSNGDKTVRLWDAASGKQLHSFDVDNCIGLAFSPDGQSLASTTGGDTRTWDMATKELQIRCDGPCWAGPPTARPC